MFDRSNMPNKDAMVALWHHKTNITQTMAAKPDTHIVAKLEKEGLAANYWELRGTLLLPTRIRLNTVRALSVRLNERGLGSAWVPCKPDVSGIETETLEKTICAYLNSSMGALTLLGGRSNKSPSYPQFSIDDMRNFPVPNFAAIGGPVVSRLAAAYDQYANAVMLPLPQMNDCPARQGLDMAVIDALELDAEEVGSIRRQLAMEPSVTGKRYAGLGR